MFFCCKKCWSIHPHFFDDDNLFGGIIIMHVWSTSSGVWDDCLGGWVGGSARRVSVGSGRAAARAIRTWSHRLSFS